MSKAYLGEQVQNIKPLFQRKQRRKRRTIAESLSDRDFICGCGKSYLSYPALYTHVKHKHNGIDPPGTTSIDKKKCGRPRVGVFLMLFAYFLFRNTIQVIRQHLKSHITNQKTHPRTLTKHS